MDSSYRIVLWLFVTSKVWCSTQYQKTSQFPVFSNVTNLNRAPKSNFYLKDQMTPNKSEEGGSGVEDQDLYQRTSSGAIWHFW